MGPSAATHTPWSEGRGGSPSAEALHPGSRTASSHCDLTEQRARGSGLFIRTLIPLGVQPRDLVTSHGPPDTAILGGWCWHTNLGARKCSIHSVHSFLAPYSSLHQKCSGGSQRRDVLTRRTASEGGPGVLSRGVHRGRGTGEPKESLGHVAPENRNLMARS